MDIKTDIKANSGFYQRGTFIASGQPFLLTFRTFAAPRNNDAVRAQYNTVFPISEYPTLHD